MRVPSLPLPQAGGEIDSWCTKCLLTLNHRIIAVVKGVPAKVECLTCYSSHKYRPNPHNSASSIPPSPSRSALSSKTLSKKGRKTNSEEKSMSFWAFEVAQQPADVFKLYAVSSLFQEGDWIVHFKFGKGKVKRVIERHKIEVLFQDGVRLLVQGFIAS
ncbi:hypothetical protein BCY86_06580 [Pajaroellobacter abortibovis]|uniref:Uncharacterized protein n=2 Tax=Pajaroellobacter abortibovis TaxID=1882918 RepID=A0A1L6N020_9BACT|nr:hypothetical protein BCY86_06580 [Pajaroellobacter abortibovis]